MLINLSFYYALELWNYIGGLKIKVDIVGGGIGGLSAAISLKKNDKSIKVMVYEKHKNIGYNHDGRRCGEAYSIEKEWSKWFPEKHSYYNEIKTGLVYLGEKKYEYRKASNFYNKIFIKRNAYSHLILHYQGKEKIIVEILNVRLIKKPEHLNNSPYLTTEKIFAIKLGKTNII